MFTQDGHDINETKDQILLLVCETFLYIATISPFQAVLVMSLIFVLFMVFYMTSSYCFGRKKNEWYHYNLAFSLKRSTVFSFPYSFIVVIH